MSYENEVRDLAGKCEEIPDKVSISTLRYIWQAGPFSLNRNESLPRFLTRVNVLKEFSDYELRLLSKYLHQRKFQRNEVVFRQGDAGYGFYFVFKGSVSIVHISGKEVDVKEHVLAKIEKSQYFGEMGLLEEYNRRSATAICLEETVLLGLFKPDLEALLDQHPVVGAKFMREISLILAQRLGALTEEVSKLRHRLGEKEKAL
ncbi:MAG: cyclic nucleotide-binding domain-containing protein [Bacteriovoracia bacterium]